MRHPHSVQGYYDSELDPPLMFLLLPLPFHDVYSKQEEEQNITLHMLAQRDYLRCDFTNVSVTEL